MCVNTNPYLRTDPVTEAVNRLVEYIEKKNLGSMHNETDEEADSDDEIRPFKGFLSLIFSHQKCFAFIHTENILKFITGFAKPLSKYRSSIDETVGSTSKTNRLLLLIDEHVEEALSNGFDDSIAKYKGKGHFVVRFPSTRDFFTHYNQ